MNNAAILKYTIFLIIIDFLFSGCSVLYKSADQTTVVAPQLNDLYNITVSSDTVITMGEIKNYNGPSPLTVNNETTDAGENLFLTAEVYNEHITDKIEQAAEKKETTQSKHKLIKREWVEGKTGITLGILAIISAFLAFTGIGFIAALVLGIMGIIYSTSALNSAEAAGNLKFQKKARLALAFSVAALIIDALWIVCLLAYILFILFHFADF